MEGRVVPLSDARLPGARPPRGNISRCRRSLCDRLVARDEPGRTQRRGRRSRPPTGDRLRQQHGRHLPSQRDQPRASCRAESRRGRECARRRRVQLRSRVEAAQKHHAWRNIRSAAAAAEGGRDPPHRRHHRARPPRVQVVGRPPAVDRVARPGSCQDDDHHRTDRLGAPRRQGRRGEARRDPAGLRRSPACLRRNRAVCHPHVQPDNGRPARSFPARRRSRTITSSSRGGKTTNARRTLDAHSRASMVSRSRTTRRRGTVSSISIFPSRVW